MAFSRGALRPRIGLATIVSPFEVGADRVPEIASTGEHRLRGLQAELFPVSTVIRSERDAREAAEELRRADLDVLCLLVGTWSEDHLVLEIVERTGLPLITWAMPGIHTGSLCGAQQICSVLKELRRPYKFVYGELSGDAPLTAIVKYARAIALKNRLRAARFGLIGSHIKGMTEVAFDEFELRSLFGCSVAMADALELERWTRESPEEEARRIWEDLKRRVGKVVVPDGEGIVSTRTYLGLKRFVEDQDLCGLAIQCYPALMGRVCLAYSLLSEEGIVGACEGDINSAVAMYMLYLLSGEPVHNTDLLAVDEEQRTVVFSHCGSGGFSLAGRPEDISLGPVRLAESGVCVLFPARPGPVTMVNLVGRKDTYRMCVIEAEALPTEMVFPGNPLKARVPVDIGDLLDVIAENGFGHHWMIGYGHFGSELAELARSLAMKLHFSPHHPL